jgi:hypothetical protein
MPNWVDNEIIITGNASSLKEIVDARFDFQTLHPCPFINGEEHQEGWYDWCVKHWGTKWAGRDILIDYEEGDSTMVVTCRTAWSAPHGFLGYLTTKYSELKIENTWNLDSNEAVGTSVYEGGVITSKSLDPSEYTLEALEKFASENVWFMDIYNNIKNDVENEVMEIDQDAKVKVILHIWTMTYKKFITQT